MPSPALPHDVWLNIANYIPILALRNLYSLNSSLFHIALDARYRQISFIYWDDRLLRNLIRLRDPYIARRVKILHMYPGFLKEVMDKEVESKEKEKEKEREKHPSSFRVRLAQQLRDFTGSKGHGEQQGGGPVNLYELPPRQGLERLRERLKTAQDVMHAVLELLRSLPSLTEYYVTWYGLLSTESSSSSSSPLPFPFPDNSDGLSLTNLAVPCIGTPLLSPTLNKLSLDISLENIHALCTASFHVSRLEHLHLHLHSDHQLSPESHHYILHTRLANSINDLSPFLRSLSIEAHQPMDIGPLLTGLKFLEKLDTVALALPLQKPHLGNPKALGRFLRRQAATIKVLRLRATQHDAGSAGSSSHWRRIGTPDPWSLNTWIQTAFGSEAGGDYQEWFDEDDTPQPLGEYDLDALESLEVSSNLLPLETALYCAERFGGKVKALALLGSVKSFEFVKELVKVLGRSRGSSSPHSRRLSLTSVVEESDGDEVVWQWLTPAPVVPPASSNEPLLAVNTNLRTLRIGPVSLSPQLLDLLANNLQSLQHLELIVKHFLPSQEDVPIYSASRRTDGDGAQLEEQVYEFLETMQNEWVWPWWDLKTISVYSESPTLSMPLSLPLPVPPTPSNYHTESQTPTRESMLTVPIPLSSSKGPKLPSSSTSSSTTIPSHTSSTSDFKAHSSSSPASRSSVTLHGPQHSSSAPITRNPSSSTTALVASSSPTSALPPLPTPASSSSKPGHRRSTQTASSIPPVPELPPLPQLQLPLPPFHTVSLSTPASPVGGLLPSPASSSADHSPVVGHSPSVSAPVSGSSRGKMRVPAASASTPALPRNFPSTTSPSSNSGHGKVAGPSRTGGSFWRAESMTGGGGASALADAATGKCRVMSVPHRDDGTTTTTGVGQQQQQQHPNSVRSHHMFSFLKPKGKLWKGKEKERDRSPPTIPTGLWGTLRVSNVVHNYEQVEAINVAVGFSHRQLQEQWREQQVGAQKKRDKQRAREGVPPVAPAATTTTGGDSVIRLSSPLHPLHSGSGSRQTDLYNNTTDSFIRSAANPPPTRTRSHNGHRRHRDQWDLFDSERDRDRRRRKGKSDPLSSFGSISSEVSGVSRMSGISGLSWADSFEDGGASKGGDGNSRSASGGVQEERITLEVALAEVLARCLPGVRVVR